MTGERNLVAVVAAKLHLQGMRTGGDAPANARDGSSGLRYRGHSIQEVIAGERGSTKIIAIQQSPNVQLFVARARKDAGEGREHNNHATGGGRRQVEMPVGDIDPRL